MLYGLFGWKITALYIGAGLVIATVAGWVIGRFLGRWVEPFSVRDEAAGQDDRRPARLSWDDRLAMVQEVVTILARSGPTSWWASA